MVHKLTFLIISDEPTSKDVEASLFWLKAQNIIYPLHVQIIKICINYNIQGTLYLFSSARIIIFTSTRYIIMLSLLTNSHTVGLAKLKPLLWWNCTSPSSWVIVTSCNLWQRVMLPLVFFKDAVSSTTVRFSFIVTVNNPHSQNMP